MAIIYTYPGQSIITGKELVLISDDNDQQSTRNITLQQIANLNGTNPGVSRVYFADSLGMLTPNEISKFMLFFKDIYPIKTGFHNHNNHGTIFGNLINLLNCNIDIIDGTLSGFGKNGGNANLEQLLLYLIIKEKYNLNIYSLLELIEKLKNVDFGKSTKININEIKIMLQQFLGVHSSYLKPIMDKSLVEIYDELSKLKNIKKDWTK